jgi:Methyltransferase domain
MAENGSKMTGRRIAAAVRWRARAALRGLRPNGRQRLIRKLPKGAVGAEIGVWKGTFSAALLERLEPRELHLVDPWEFMPEKPQAIYGGGAVTGQRDMDQIYQEVVNRFASATEAGRVTVHRGRSVEIASSFPDSYFDWIYVDGDHSYEGVTSDLAAWRSKIKPGGCITGDDYMTDGAWFGDSVKRAVDEFVAPGDYRLEWLAECQFLLRRSPR